jgi:hypothetical protein
MGTAALIVVLLIILAVVILLVRWRIRAWRASDAPMATAPRGDADIEEGSYAINPSWTAVAVLGGVLLAVASFLPLDEPGRSLGGVRSNTLVQHGEWWLLIGGAVVVAAALRSYTDGRREEATSVMVLGVIAAVLVVYFAQDKALRTLYPLNGAGEADSSATGTVVPLAIAIYVAGAGALLAVVGGRGMRQSARMADVDVAEATRTKRCPDCAELVLTGARVCKHCGYRFESLVQDGGGV